jgi:acid phosphatase family membrane protein YuiD
MYNLIIIPVITVVIAQIIKLIIDGVKGKFSWANLNAYGGMPSAHTALVMALLISVGYYQGLDSPGFAISLVFAFLVVRDAMGFRRQLGMHAKTINDHIEQLPGEKSKKFDHLDERLGHKPSEIIGGIIVGIVIPIIYILVI